MIRKMGNETLRICRSVNYKKKLSVKEIEVDLPTFVGFKVEPQHVKEIGIGAWHWHWTLKNHIEACAIRFPGTIRTAPHPRWLSTFS